MTIRDVAVVLRIRFNNYLFRNTLAFKNLVRHVTTNFARNCLLKKITYYACCIYRLSDWSRFLCSDRCTCWALGLSKRFVQYVGLLGCSRRLCGRCGFVAVFHWYLKEKHHILVFNGNSTIENRCSYKCVINPSSFVHCRISKYKISNKCVCLEDIFSNVFTKTGSAFLPSNHSSAVIAGTSPGVSGYKSSWNNSDWRRKHHEEVTMRPRFFLPDILLLQWIQCSL